VSERPALRPTERRYGWTLALIGVLVALIAQLPRPASDDVDGLLGVLGLVFSLGYIAFVGAGVLAARYLMSSSALRVTTILAGPVLGLLALNTVIRLLT
jgi:hypothetical protein